MEALTDLKSNSIKHLYNLATVLPETPTPTVLKSYFLTQCFKLAKGSSITLPSQFSSQMKRCPRCCMLYNETASTNRINPLDKKNRFVCRLLQREELGKTLTKFQRTFLKKLKSKSNINAHNKMVVTCGVCKHKVHKPLIKPKEQIQIEEKPVIKKKKKKDKFSGLNQDVVLAITSKNKLNSRIPSVLESTTISTNPKKELKLKKNIFANNNNNNSQQNGTQHIKTLLKAKEKNRKQHLKGIQSILNGSKHKNSPSITLKHFLSSI